MIDGGASCRGAFSPGVETSLTAVPERAGRSAGCNDCALYSPAAVAAQKVAPAAR